MLSRWGCADHAVLVSWWNHFHTCALVETMLLHGQKGEHQPHSTGLHAKHQLWSMIVDVRSLDLQCASEAVDRAHFVPMVTSDSAYAESPLCGAWCIHVHSLYSLSLDQLDWLDRLFFLYISFLCWLLFSTRIGHLSGYDSENSKRVSDMYFLPPTSTYPVYYFILLIRTFCTFWLLPVLETVVADTATRMQEHDMVSFCSRRCGQLHLSAPHIYAQALLQLITCG